MLKIAYLSTENQPKATRISAKQRLHNAAVAQMVKDKIQDKERAKKMFAAEIAEIEQLKKRLKELTNKKGR
jgi:predicted transcriptional regulator